MSYRIQYGVSKVEQSSKQNKRKVWIYSVVVLVLVFLTTVIWPEWTRAFRKELFPLFTEEGIRAVQNFSSNLEMGASLSDAIEVFCREIMNGSVS